MKRKFRYTEGFTLVELLIVIALIAILAVGILATINPVEQRNKATDANTLNDAGEVLNAYERYYANSNAYPWMIVDNSILIDNEFGTVSNRVGAGLCGTNVAGPTTQSLCSAYDYQGGLIATDELKASFLNKGYTYNSTSVPSGTTYNDLNMLYVYKADSTSNNSIYVCHVPKAKANRTSANRLKILTFDANGAPDSIADAPSVAFDGSGNPVNPYTFESLATSLFKCVP